MRCGALAATAASNIGTSLPGSCTVSKAGCSWGSTDASTTDVEEAARWRRESARPRGVTSRRTS
jgi:hypothetical protein